MKDCFLGSNTPQGFFSYYSSIMKGFEGGRLIILKGGSGCGKSTLIKKVIEFAHTLGYESEKYHCSSDVFSLDGAMVKKLKLAIVDGTSPHIVDCKAYGIEDEIVNLGDAITKTKIRPYAERVMKLLSQKQNSYLKAYSYLNSSQKILDSVNYEFSQNENKKAYLDNIKKLTEKINTALNTEFIQKDEQINRVPGIKKVFASTVTSSGYVDYFDEIFNDSKKVIIVDGGFEKQKSDILKTESEQLLNQGYFIQGYYNPIYPTELLGFSVIDDNCDMVLSVVATTFIKTYSNPNVLDIADFSECYKFEDNDQFKSQIEQAKKLIIFAEESLLSASLMHNEIEKIYLPSIDFGIVNQKIAGVIDEIMTFCH